MKILVFDVEGLGNRPSSIILDIAAVIYDTDKRYTFDQLVNDESNIFYRKLSVKSQSKTRTVDTQTIDWWKGQSAEARKVLKPSEDDVSLDTALKSFYNFLQDKQFNIKKDIAMCRGTSYDFSIIADAAHQTVDTFGLGYSMFPCAFYHQRDVRTALAYSYNVPNMKKFPILKTDVQKFVKHNSIHDVCKDILLLQTADMIVKEEIEFNESDYVLV